MAKFVLGGTMVLIMGLLLAILCGIGWLFGDFGLVIGFLLWGSCIKFVHLIVMNYAGYMAVATTAEITIDLYGKLSNISAKFKELWEKGKAENPQSAYTGEPVYDPPAYDTPVSEEPAAMPEAIPQQISGGRFCSECGAKNDSGAGFCGSCGTKL